MPASFRDKDANFLDELSENIAGVRNMPAYLSVAFAEFAIGKFLDQGLLSVRANKFALHDFGVGGINVQPRCFYFHLFFDPDVYLVYHEQRWCIMRRRIVRVVKMKSLGSAIIYAYAIESNQPSAWLAGVSWDDRT